MSENKCETCNFEKNCALNRAYWKDECGWQPKPEGKCETCKYQNKEGLTLCNEIQFAVCRGQHHDSYSRWKPKSAPVDYLNTICAGCRTLPECQGSNIEDCQRRPALVKASPEPKEIMPLITDDNIILHCLEKKFGFTWRKLICEAIKEDVIGKEVEEFLLELVGGNRVLQRDAALDWLNNINRAGGNYYHDGKWWKTFEFQIPVEEWEKCQTKK